jgi:hypothetical protein
MTKTQKITLAMIFAVFTTSFIVKFAFDRRVEAGVLAIKIGDGLTAVKKLTPTAYLGNRTSQELLAYVYSCEEVGVAYDQELALFWLGKFSNIQGLSNNKESIQAAANCIKRG